MYSVGRRTKRWPLCLFFNFLDVVAINSAVIYKAVKQDGGMARKDFIKQLALQLMRDALNMRNQAKNLSRDLQVLIQKHAGTSSLEKRPMKRPLKESQKPKKLCSASKSSPSKAVRFQPEKKPQRISSIVRAKKLASTQSPLRRETFLVKKKKDSQNILRELSPNLNQNKFYGSNLTSQNSPTTYL
ncbi:hypothetical protein LAZ67_15001759 [Cordylochernes scorpioides]|uniref:Uncharacterized protein n=1 Tax=Cordylochernes scorpioides TaxID=51811 RepID=A0ABY6L8Z7_9ARAC|nr:hypothetical protein LAZ67_15001759 [Cordylochernes scorpioides]